MLNKLTRTLTAMALCAGLSVCFTACDDDDDNGGSSNVNPSSAKDYTQVAGKLNTPSAATQKDAKNSPSCEKLKGTTDTSLTDVTEVINYLVGICTISEYFQFDAFVQNESKGEIGDSCFCYGRECVMAGYQRPEQATIFGCGGVPASQNGAVRGCFRSTNAAPLIKPTIYFPNGMCTLMMSRCYQTSGDCTVTDCVEIDQSYTNPNADPTKEMSEYDNSDYICGFATFGDWSKVNEFTSCPDDAVLVDFNMPIAVYAGTTLSQSAKIDARLCLPSCETDADCHGSNEYDAIIGEPGQVKCLETATLCKDDRTVASKKVCFDKRVIDQSSIGLCAVPAPTDAQ